MGWTKSFGLGDITKNLLWLWVMQCEFSPEPHIKQHTSSEAQREFIPLHLLPYNLKLLYIKPRPAYRDNVRPLMLAWDYDSSQSWQSWQRVTEGAKAVNCHSPWQTGCTFLSTEAWVNHNSKHRTSTLSSFNTLPWWTCVRWGEEVRWLTPIICCLTSWQFSGFM